jgi:TfoX/Sxy family transcriptional regulator of competence genes
MNMSYDENLAHRIRTLLKGMRGLQEKKLFGGVGFLLNGNMACGVHKDSLIVRIEPEGATAALRQPPVRPFEISGRPMQGWILVSAEGCRKSATLAKWVNMSVTFAKSLPRK